MTEHSTPTDHVLDEIAAERVAQNAKWGEQNHPDGTGEAFAPAADAARDLCERAFSAKRGNWQVILTEEAYEAFAESDPVKLRRELVQVAAVAVAWIEAIDRRKS